MTDINFEQKHPRGITGQFAAKEGEAAAVSLPVSTNDFRHAEDIPQLMEDYETLTSPENLYGDGEASSLMVEKRLTRYAAHAVNRAAELADEESANETVGFVHRLVSQSGRPDRAFGANYARSLGYGDQRRTMFLDGGSPVVGIAADRAVVIAGSKDGTVTVHPRVNADIFVAEDAQVSIIFEDGSSGRVISASSRATVRGTPNTVVIGDTTPEAWPGIHRGALKPE